jgi:hypothetical protein
VLVHPKKNPCGYCCQKTNELVQALIESIPPNEISDTLANVFEVYLQHAKIDGISLANAYSVIYRLNNLFFNLSTLQKLQADGEGLAVHSESEKEKCLHN